MGRRSVWAPLASLALAPAASADDSGWYVGAGFGLVDSGDKSQLSYTDLPLLTGRTDDNKTSWSLAAGYRFNQYIGIELGYVDLGKVTSEVADASGATDARAAVGFSAEGVTLAMIGTFPIGKWEPYLKAGVFYSSTVLEVSGSQAGADFGGRTTNDDEDALYGIGVGYAVSERLRIYLDSTIFPTVGEREKGRADYLNTSLGATWRF